MHHWQMTIQIVNRKGLNVSQRLLDRMLRSRQEIENVSLANEYSERKMKRAGKEEKVV